MGATTAILLTAMTTVVLGGTTALADEVILNPVNDNTLYERDQGDISNGAGVHMFAGTNNSGAIRRALIAFDITSGVPAGSVITGVSLTLNMSRTISGEQAVELRRVLSNWGEGGSDAGQNEGGGGPADSGDATWLHTYWDSETWSEPGGDFSDVVSASLPVGELGSYTWETTAELEADVQGWYDEPENNFGWILIGEELISRSARRFDSSETILELTPGSPPRLTIAYDPPVSSARAWKRYR